MIAIIIPDEVWEEFYEEVSQDTTMVDGDNEERRSEQIQGLAAIIAIDAIVGYSLRKKKRNKQKEK